MSLSFQKKGIRVCLNGRKGALFQTYTKLFNYRKIDKKKKKKLKKTYMGRDGNIFLFILLSLLIK